MKLCVSSDYHLDATTAGFDRFDDVSAAIDETVAAAIDERVDLFLFLGDLCDPDAHRAPRCVGKAIEAARSLHGANIGSRWLTGNHDVIEDGSGTSTLTPLAAASQRPSADTLGWGVVDEPFAEVIQGVLFVWLPYVPRCKNYEAAKFIRELGMIWDLGEPAIEDPRNHTRSVVVAGHLSIHGQVPGSETLEMSRGRDLWLPVDAIRERWPSALILNGHYHTSQVEDVVIPGSLARLTFAEEANNPGFMIVEVP